MQTERTVSRFTFGLVVFVGVIVMSCIEVILTKVISRRLGLRGDLVGGLVGGLQFANVLIVHHLADRAFKSMGLSRSSKTIEGRRPATAAPLHAGDEESIEIHCARSFSNGLALLSLGIAALGFLISGGTIPKRAQPGGEVLAMFYGVFLSLAALAFLVRFIKVIRIDAEGVTGYTSSFAILRTTIPWSQIACCELVVLRDTFGKIAVAFPRFRDHDGKDLFPALGWGLWVATPQNQQSLLHNLKRRFPKLDSDPWEL